MNDHDSSSIRLASRLAGAVWGVLVGDAVGVPYEFGDARPAEEVRFGEPGGPWRQPAGTWSDDGALTLALLDSLLTRGFDLDHQGRRFRAWRDDGAYTPDGDGRFDIGATTFRALARLDEGIDPADAGPKGERECGNGSLMRILPLALVGRDWPREQLVERAHLASRVTHGHARAQAACAVYSLAAASLVRGDPEPELALGAAFDFCKRWYAGTDGLEGHAGALGELRGWGARSGSGFVLDAFWSAWEAFAGASDYADAIRRAVAYGHDTDTTAAIAGGLAGARWGWEGIPAEWRHGMRGREVAQPLVDRLVETIEPGRWSRRFRTSSSSPLRVDLLDLAGTDLEGTGRVGITFLPGKKRDGFTGPWWRDLHLDLARLRGLGVDTLFLLVEDDELASCLVADLPRVMAAEGPELVRFPVHDPRTPVGREREYRAAVRDLVARVGAGRFVAIACRGGMDRSGMTAACLYREIGLDADEAIRRVQAARHNTITIREQQDFVRDWPRDDPRDDGEDAAAADVEAAARSASVSVDALQALGAWADVFADSAFAVGEWAGGERLDEKTIQMPWYDLSAEAARFEQEMYAAGLVQPVSWMSWVGTPRGHALLDDPAAVAAATPGELLYLVTSVIRGERFGDGTIEGAFERGILLAAARRARDLAAG